ncbi:thioredoxin fold domain-containing protein [Thermocrinis sp.]|uniref:thioredoxin family protein n=1 Tax=Thermocrinis sp. TaxID=2024383 RepID=UPI002FDCBB95
MMSIVIKLLVVGLFLYGNSLANEKINRAISENKLVVFYFKSQFCPYCAQVEDFVFSDEEVFKKLSNFVFVELDIRSDEGSKLARKFGVPGTPTVVIYDPKQDRVVSLIFGSRPKEDYLKTITKACKLYNIKTC